MAKLKYWYEHPSKGYGLVSEKNLVAPQDGTFSRHMYGWPVTAYSYFRKFNTRQEAREFKKALKSKTYIVQLESGCVVR